MRLEREPVGRGGAVVPTVSERAVGVTVSPTGLVGIRVGRSTFSLEDPYSKSTIAQLEEVSAIALKLLGLAEKALLEQEVRS